MVTLPAATYTQGSTTVTLGSGWTNPDDTQDAFVPISGCAYPEFVPRASQSLANIHTDLDASCGRRSLQHVRRRPQCPSCGRHLHRRRNARCRQASWHRTAAHVGRSAGASDADALLGRSPLRHLLARPFRLASCCSHNLLAHCRHCTRPANSYFRITLHVSLLTPYASLHIPRLAQASFSFNVCSIFVFRLLSP